MRVVDSVEMSIFELKGQPVSVLHQSSLCGLVVKSESAACLSSEGRTFLIVNSFTYSRKTVFHIYFRYFLQFPQIWRKNPPKLKNLTWKNSKCKQWQVPTLWQNLNTLAVLVLFITDRAYTHIATFAVDALLVLLGAYRLRLRALINIWWEDEKHLKLFCWKQMCSEQTDHQTCASAFCVLVTATTGLALVRSSSCAARTHNVAGWKRNKAKVWQTW